jgi:uncharacterized membrane protein YdjX (TVP38/TMEM64 family)
MPILSERSAPGLARRLPLVLAVVAALLFIAMGGRQYVSLAALETHTSWLRAAADDWAVLAPILFVAANAAMLLMLVIPAWFCTIVSGLLFGPWMGTAWALVGTTLGATGVFLAARGGFTGLIQRAGPRAETVAAGFRSNAFSYLVVLRLVPLVPFTLVNIASALAGLPLGLYVLATLVGIVPSVMIYACFGDLLIDLARQGQPNFANLLWQPRFLFPLLGLAALALVPVLIGRFRRRH